jgi:hypothetical protein
VSDNATRNLTGRNLHIIIKNEVKSLFGIKRITLIETLLTVFTKWETKLAAAISEGSLFCQLNMNFYPILFWYRITLFMKEITGDYQCEFNPLLKTFAFDKH